MTITADFGNVQVGQSVEGLGVVAPYLNIDAVGTAVKVAEGVNPLVYGAPNVGFIVNGGVAASGGFSDAVTKNALQPHLYTFTFAQGVSVSSFSLHMLDYGDYNPSNSTSHLVTLTAYDLSNAVVQQEILDFTSVGNSSPEYGNLLETGDAIDAVAGEPGNWTWNVSGTGIVRIVLEFGVGYDPNIALDLLSFTTECPICQPADLTADFSNIQAGQSVEALGAVAPYLRIEAKGEAKKVAEGVNPLVYGAPNVGFIVNGGVADGGGFSDVDTKNALQSHLYTFSFAQGVSVSNFSLHMLDYGDFNPSNSTSHLVTLTAYNAGNAVVDQQMLDFTSQGDISPQYGNLILTGDAIDAVAGQPGNWTWNVSGTGIVRIVLEFGVGHDPNIAFDTLSFSIECP
jgi:hypothetical protein